MRDINIPAIRQFILPLLDAIETCDKQVTGELWLSGAEFDKLADKLVTQKTNGISMSIHTDPTDGFVRILSLVIE